MRFLHLADLHLDTSFAGRRAEVRERLREATREALLGGVRTAIDAEVDVVLIAGDLFDSERLSFRTERFLVDALDRLGAEGIPVVYATGNHDPGGAGGAAARIDWPASVTVLTGPEPQRLPVVSKGRTVGWVTGAGHDSPRVADDLSARFPSPVGDLPEVALLHTQVVGSPGEGAHDRYAPSSLAHLRRTGYDYWALGHIHAGQALSSDPPVLYPGNIQGRHPGESGPRGGLLVEIDGASRGAGQLHGRARVEFVELGPVRWETLRVEGLAEASRFGALARRLEAEWRDERATDPGPTGAEWLLRIELVGPSPLHRELAHEEDRRELEKELRDTLGLLDVEVRAEELRPPLDPAAWSAREDVSGEALRMLESLAAADGPSPSELLGIERAELAAIDPGDDLDAYLRAQLRGEAPALLDALLAEEGEP